MEVSRDILVFSNNGAGELNLRLRRLSDGGRN